MDTRRKFIRGAGFLGLLATGAVGAREATAVPIVVNEHTHIHSKTPEVDPNMVKMIEEINPSCIQLSSTYGEIAPPPPPPKPSNYIGTDGVLYSTGTTFAPTWATTGLTLNSNGSLVVRPNNKEFVEGTEKTIDVDVKLVPGPDGELYLNVNGQWKKVLTTV